MVVHYYRMAMSVGLSFVICLPSALEAMLTIGYNLHWSATRYWDINTEEDLGNQHLMSIYSIPKATRGLEPISYRGVLVSTLLHATVHVFYTIY
jgi:hypothetical protein